MMMYNTLKKSVLFRSALFKNSAWGVMSNIVQTLFVVIFFAICARQYNSQDFAQFLVSSTVYQLVAAFSSMGLGQWFIREYATNDDRTTLTGKFFKTQMGLGAIFYMINIALAYILYPEGQIRILCVLLGTNIIFDNFINAIKSLNIAEFRQKNTAAILVLDAFLKMLVGSLLFIDHFSTTILAALMVFARLLTLAFLAKSGSFNSISLSALASAKVSLDDLRNLILKNWQFIVIGSISIVYWRIANIIISKTLTLTNVADFEISFRIFALAQTLPVIVSATIFPRFISYYNEKNYKGLTSLYRDIFFYYSLFSLISYAFIYSFSSMIVPVVVGDGYPGATLCLQEMFLTFLLMPTVLLQANLIVAVGLEKLDMWFNILSVAVNLIGCFIGLYFFKSLSVINYSIFISFVVFHISQDWLLVRRKLTNLKHCISFYAGLGAFVGLYNFSSTILNKYVLFAVAGAILVVVYFLRQGFKNKAQQHDINFTSYSNH